MTWLERLDECDRLINAEDWEGLTEWVRKHGHDAFVWITCACGEQDKRIPRDPDGRPKDDLLEDLGGQFYTNWLDIKDERSTAEARATLAAIERRAAEILAEVTA